MIANLLFVGAILVLSTAANTTESKTAKIIGGTHATSPTEFPYQISIQSNGRHTCGGSIISPTHIVTAAHCISSPSAIRYTIKAGIVYRSKREPTTQVRSISKIRAHPQWDSRNLRNDIAILELSSPFTFNEAVNSIALAEPGVVIPTGTMLVASGWGKTESGSIPDGLLKVHIPVTSEASCKAIYRSKILSSMICAGKKAMGVCNGDSGGPLATINGKRILIGLTSFGPHRCGSTPGVYTRLSSFSTWITSITGPIL